MTLGVATLEGIEAATPRSHAVASKAQPRISALTGLRFFAAAFILVEHTVDWLAQFSNVDFREKIAFVGSYGMPLFFVLSGFVIHYNYRRLFLSRSIARATCEFAAARFARLFPLYFCLLAVAICADNLLDQVQGDRTLFFGILAYYVTLTQSWWYVVYGNKLIINWVFGLSWSISTEMFFYAAYVAVIFIILLMRRGRTALESTIGYGVIVTCLFVLSRHFLGAILSAAEHYVPNYITFDDSENSFYRWFFYFSPYVRVFEFFMGCLTAHAFILVREHPVGFSERQYASVILGLVFAFLALCGLLYLGIVDLGRLNGYVAHMYLNFLYAPPLAFIIFYAARYDSWLTRVLSLPPIIALGDASYSIYLIHTWTLRIFVRQPPPFSLAWGIETLLRMVCGIGLTLITAYATYRLIEMPSRAWLRSKLGSAISIAFCDNATAAVDPELFKKKEVRTTIRLLFSAAAIMLLATVGIVGAALQSDMIWEQLRRWRSGNRPSIEIVSATYGMNCKNFAVSPPHHNAVSAGNATAAVGRTCNYRTQCQLQIGPALSGDPANGCEKDFSVEYNCSDPSSIVRASVPAEAAGKILRLDCESAASHR